VHAAIWTRWPCGSDLLRRHLTSQPPVVGGPARLHAALHDAEEDRLEAHYIEHPCEETARALLRQRAADRRASLRHDQEIAAKFGD